MLLRTADSLYWMSRHMERAENTARLLNAQYQFSLLNTEKDSVLSQWKKVLELFELEELYKELEKKISPQKVIKFMIVEQDNPSSLINSLWNARENARCMRGVIPTDLWVIINSIWLDFENIFKKDDWLKDLERSLGWVRERSYSFRGVLEGIMPINEFLYFSRIGMHLERADNTARILDISFNVMTENFLLTQSVQDERNEENQLKNFEEFLSIQNNKNFYFWITVLRSLSASEIYRQVFSDKINPIRVAELLISRKDFPRSLLVCLHNLQKQLENVSTSDNHLSNKLVGKLSGEIFYETIDKKFILNIHDFSKKTLFDINNLGKILSNEFLIPLPTSESSTKPIIRTIDE